VPVLRFSPNNNQENGKQTSLLSPHFQLDWVACRSKEEALGECESFLEKIDEGVSRQWCHACGGWQGRDTSKGHPPLTPA